MSNHMTESVAKQKLLLLVVPAMILPFIASLFYFKIWSDHPLASALYGLVKVFTVVWPLIAFRVINGSWLPKWDRKNPVHLEALRVGAISGVILVVILFCALMTPIGAAVTEATPAIHKKASQLGFL